MMFVFLRNYPMYPKKKLVFFDFITHYGGAQRASVLLNSRLRPYYDIQIVDAYGCCHAYVSDLLSNKLPVHVLMGYSKDVVIGHSGSRLRRFISLFRQIPRLFKLLVNLNVTIKRISPDLIWTNSVKALFFLSISKKFNGLTIGFYAHTWGLKNQFVWWQRLIIKRSADIVFVVSEPTQKAMTSWGVAQNKIHVVFPAMDFHRLKKNPSSSTINHLKKNHSDFHILVPGSLLYAKGQHTVLGALNHLKHRNSARRYIAWLAGDTGIGDTSGYVQRLRTLTETYGLKDDVHFLGWRNDIPDLMCCADVIVLPSHTEGMPLVIQEAIMLKRPVIATNVGGIPDLIDDARTGFIVSVDDEITLADKIQFIAESGIDLDAMVRRAYEHYTTRFDGENQLNRFRSAIETVLSTIPMEKRL